jgi:hypothetical protein
MLRASSTTPSASFALCETITIPIKASALFQSSVDSGQFQKKLLLRGPSKDAKSFFDGMI